MECHVAGDLPCLTTTIITHLHTPFLCPSLYVRLSVCLSVTCPYSLVTAVRLHNSVRLATRNY